MKRLASFLRNLHNKCNQSPLFLEFNSKIKLGDQQSNLRTTLDL